MTTTHNLVGLNGKIMLPCVCNFWLFGARQLQSEPADTVQGLKAVKRFSETVGLKTQ